MATKELQITGSKAMSICLKNGYKIEPIQSGEKSFRIKVNKPDGTFKVYDKTVYGEEVGRALRKTNIAWAKLILKQIEEENAKQTDSEKKRLSA